MEKQLSALSPQGMRYAKVTEYLPNPMKNVCGSCGRERQENLKLPNNSEKKKKTKNKLKINENAISNKKGTKISEFYKR